MLKAQKREGWQVVEVNTALEFCVPVPQKRKSWKGKPRREKNMMHEEDGKLENSEEEQRREKVGCEEGKRKKKKKGKESPEIKVE